MEKGKKQGISKDRNYVSCGRAAYYQTLSSGVIGLTSTALLTGNARLAGLSDMYQLYRFRKLRFNFSEGSWGSGLTAGKYSTGYAAGLYLEVPDTPPSTDHTKLLECPHSMFMSGSWAAAGAVSPSGYQGPLQAGYPNQAFTVQSKHLLGAAPYKWWRTRTGSSSTDSWQLTQWTLFMVAEDTSLGSGLQFTYWIDYEIEFSDPVDPAQTPAPLLKTLDSVDDLTDEQRKLLAKKLANITLG